MEEEEQEGAPAKAFEPVFPKSARNNSEFSLQNQPENRFTFAKSVNMKSEN